LRFDEAGSPEIRLRFDEDGSLVAGGLGCGYADMAPVPPPWALQAIEDLLPGVVHVCAADGHLQLGLDPVQARDGLDTVPAGHAHVDQRNAEGRAHAPGAFGERHRLLAAAGEAQLVGLAALRGRRGARHVVFEQLLRSAAPQRQHLLDHAVNRQIVVHDQDALRRTFTAQ
jgi:hypothetical protein